MLLSDEGGGEGLGNMRLAQFKSPTPSTSVAQHCGLLNKPGAHSEPSLPPPPPPPLPCLDFRVESEDVGIYRARDVFVNNVKAIVLIVLNFNFAKMYDNRDVWV